MDKKIYKIMEIKEIYDLFLKTNGISIKNIKKKQCILI